ncbi:MAG: RNA polymerase sigma-70 factor [Tannerella sp.]|jgi:RNA polymerase sigma-70 factor (ECF subfamily)|nr:RNA polymerase sigma-70 factor [Tannerella sp.]
MDDIGKKFEQLYRSYYSKMKHFAKEYVISDGEAEDIVQDVFMELWEKKQLFLTHTNLVAYLFTAVKNKSLNFLRHQIIRQKTAEHLQEEFMITMQMNLDSLEVLNDHFISEEDIEKALADAIDTLSPRRREIYIKSKIEGKKQEEIAEELNITVNTVETQMGIARKKLKIKLKDYLP